MDGVAFVPANSNNYMIGRDFQGIGHLIDTIVIHTTDGSKDSAVARFQDPASQVSAHYIVCLNGAVVQLVGDHDTAFHAGDWATNLRSIGIEHEDNGDYNGPRTNELYEASAQLVAKLCQLYNIVCDRSSIRKHSEVSTIPGGTACPDSLDIDRIVARAKEILTPDWQASAEAIGAKSKVLSDNLNLYDFETGQVLRSFPAGTQLEVHYLVTHNGIQYYMTHWSFNNNIPAGFNAAEFDAVAPGQLPADPTPAPAVQPDSTQINPDAVPATVVPENTPVVASTSSVTATPANPVATDVAPLADPAQATPQPAPAVAPDTNAAGLKVLLPLVEEVSTMGNVKAFLSSTPKSSWYAIAAVVLGIAVQNFDPTLLVSVFNWVHLPVWVQASLGYLVAKYGLVVLKDLRDYATSQSH